MTDRAGVEAHTTVFVASVSEVMSHRPDVMTWLTEAERARAERFHFARDRNAFLAAHVLVRACAAERTGLAASALHLEQECLACGGPHGPPRLRELPDLAVSISHSGAVVAAAIGSSPVGVDVEAGDRLETTDDRLTAVALTAAEAAAVHAAADPMAMFLELWVRKEAIVKARRRTIGDVAAIELVGDAGVIHDGYGDLRLTTWRGSDGHLGACAASSRASVRSWQPARDPACRAAPLVDLVVRPLDPCALGRSPSSAGDLAAVRTWPM